MITQDRNAKRRFIEERRNGASRSHAAMFAMFLGLAAFAILFAAQLKAADTITWTPFKDAIFRVDGGDPPPEWNLYRDAHGKGHDSLLLLWGTRYLRLDTKRQVVWELDPKLVTQDKDKVTTPAKEDAGKVLSSDSWLVHDMTQAWRVSFTLTDEKHDLDLNVPWKQ